MKAARDIRRSSRALLTLLVLSLLSSASHSAQTNSAARSTAATQPTWLGADGVRLPFASEEEILDYLRNAAVVDTERIDTGINRPVKLTLEKNGIKAHAIFRTVDRLLVDGRTSRNRVRAKRDSYVFEVAAYKINRLLGLDKVPPVVLRRIQGRDGSLQLWVENAVTEATLLSEQRGQDSTRKRLLQRQVMIAYDNLIYNFDRHLGNVLYDQSGQLWYIDHTRSFRSRAELESPEKIQLCDRQLLQNLRHLKDEEIRETLKPYLNGLEIKTLMRRRDLLVERCDRQIAEHGAELVLFDLEANLASLPQANKPKRLSAEEILERL
jgi:hypothetical protein